MALCGKTLAFKEASREFPFDLEAHSGPGLAFRSLVFKRGDVLNLFPPDSMNHSGTEAFENKFLWGDCCMMRQFCRRN